MNILILGSKEYPFHSSYKYDKYAGGGIELYVEKLAKYVNKYENNIFIITRKFPNQKSFEKSGKPQDWKEICRNRVKVFCQ